MGYGTSSTIILPWGVLFRKYEATLSEANTVIVLSRSLLASRESWESSNYFLPVLPRPFCDIQTADELDPKCWLPRIEPFQIMVKGPHSFCDFKETSKLIEISPSQRTNEAFLYFLTTVRAQLDDHSYYCYQKKSSGSFMDTAIVLFGGLNNNKNFRKTLTTAPRTSC